MFIYRIYYLFTLYVRCASTSLQLKCTTCSRGHCKLNKNIISLSLRKAYNNRESHQKEVAMALAACPSESTHLLVNTASEDPLQQKSVCISCPPSKHLCLPSKATILILLWTTIAGTIYYAAIYVGEILTITLSNPNVSLTTFNSLPYAILAIIMMFYP